MARAKKIEEGAEGTVLFGSGNLFADLGFANSDEMLAKAKLASIINEIIRDRGLNQQQAAKLMGIDQPKVSKIVRGRLEEFSTGWLLGCFKGMGVDVEILVHTEEAERKQVGSVNVASV